MNLNRRDFIKAALIGTYLICEDAHSQWAKVSQKEIEHMPGVSKVYASKGISPDVIYITAPHQVALETTDFGAPTGHLEHTYSICDALKRRGVNDLLIEGLDKQQLDSYVSTRRLNASSNSPSSKEFWQGIERILSIGWNIYAAEDSVLLSRIKEMEKPINGIHTDFTSKVSGAYEEIMNKYMGNGQVFPEEHIPLASDERIDAYNHLHQSYQSKLDNVLTEDLVRALYRHIVIDREMLCAKQALQCKDKGGQLIMLYGHSHAFSLLRTLGRHGLDYSGIIPKGIPYPIRERNIEDFKRSYGLPKNAPKAIFQIRTDKGNQLVF